MPTAIHRNSARPASKLAGPQACSHCAVRTLGILRDLSPAELVAFERHRVANQYQKGQIVFYEGNYPLGVYCIQSGRVKLSKSSASGRQQILRIAGAGELLGYQALLAGDRYLATAQAIEDCRICFLGKTAFLALASARPKVGLRLAEKVCQDFGKIEQYLFDLVNRPAEARMAKFLLYLKGVFAQNTPDGTRFSLAFSRTEMAEWLCTTPETVIRVLSRFRKRGLIQLDERNLAIVDSKNLEAVSNSSR